MLSNDYLAEIEICDNISERLAVAIKYAKHMKLRTFTGFKTYELTFTDQSWIEKLELGSDKFVYVAHHRRKA